MFPLSGGDYRQTPQLADLMKKHKDKEKMGLSRKIMRPGPDGPPCDSREREH